MRPALLGACALALVIAASSVTSAHGKSKDKTTGFRFGQFRLAHFTVLQKAGLAYSGIATWNPCVFFKPAIGLRADFGGTALKGASGLISVIEYGLMLALQLGPIGLDLGGGGQVWGGGVGHRGIGLFVLSYVFSKKLAVIDRILVGWSGLMVSGKFANEIRAGIGIAF